MSTLHTHHLPRLLLQPALRCIQPSEEWVFLAAHPALWREGAGDVAAAFPAGAVDARRVCGEGGILGGRGGTAVRERG